MVWHGLLGLVRAAGIPVFRVGNRSVNKNSSGSFSRREEEIRGKEAEEERKAKGKSSDM